MYKHTQVGLVTIISLIIPAIPIGYFAFRFNDPIQYTVFGILLLSLILFGSLSVSVDQKIITIAFGIGLIKKRYQLVDIDSCSEVRNKWWYGWGIRKIPNGWLFNVSGLDAVELVMKDGKVKRIGTDEPKVLCEYIDRRLSKNAD